MRVNKYLAECGVASRRSCDKLIAEGRVKVNGRIASLGEDIRDGDEVTVDGGAVSRRLSHSYYLMNKPKGYVCTVKDDKDRKTVMQLLPAGVGRLFPVGRLDYDTEGMLIFTDDGDLAFRLTHPKNEIEKTYLAKIEGSISDVELNRLRAGRAAALSAAGDRKVTDIAASCGFESLNTYYRALRRWQKPQE